MPVPARCPVCKALSTVDHVGDSLRVICARCGSYSISRSAEFILNAHDRNRRQLAVISGWTKENTGAVIDTRELRGLLDMVGPTVAERADKLLRAMSISVAEIGDELLINDANPLEMARWIGITWSSSAKEVFFLLEDYLLRTRGWVSQSNPGSRIFKITAQGHARLEELSRVNAESQLGFCAMWFSPELGSLWEEAIEPAILAAGYEPKRVDKHEHVNRIDDEIIALLRRSRFVVADFTGQRGGVYFEAGFALGQGIPVIWTCREDDLENLHFDTAHYNFLTWNPGNPNALAVRLTNRIEALIGKGNYRCQ